LSINFENYVILKGYDAICSYSEGTIEALIRQQSLFQSATYFYRVLFGIETREARANLPEIILSPSDETNETKIVLGFASPQCSIITDNFRLYSNNRTLSVKITGLKVSQHDKALEYLERIVVR